MVARARQGRLQEAVQGGSTQAQTQGYRQITRAALVAAGNARTDQLGLHCRWSLHRRLLWSGLRDLDEPVTGLAPLPIARERLFLVTYRCGL